MVGHNTLILKQKINVYKLNICLDLINYIVYSQKGPTLWLCLCLQGPCPLSEKFSFDFGCNLQSDFKLQWN